METYRGTLHYRLSNVGTHAEGHYAFLTPEEGDEIKLCREGGAPMNDTWFRPFDGMETCVTGTLSHGWLVVERIEPAAPAETVDTIEPARQTNDSTEEQPNP